MTTAIIESFIGTCVAADSALSYTHKAMRAIRPQPNVKTAHLSQGFLPLASAAGKSSMSEMNRNEPADRERMMASANNREALVFPADVAAQPMAMPSGVMAEVNTKAKMVC